MEQSKSNTYELAIGRMNTVEIGVHVDEIIYLDVMIGRRKYIHINFSSNTLFSSRWHGHFKCELNRNAVFTPNIFFLSYFFDSLKYITWFINLQVIGMILLYSIVVEMAIAYSLTNIPA